MAAAAAGTAISLSSALLLGCSAGTAADSAEYMVIPQPNEITYMAGSTVIPDKVAIAFPEEFASEAAMLGRYLSEDFNVRPVLRRDRSSGRILLKKDPALGSIPGQYRISADGKIEISSATAEGIFYGIQSLRQMITRDTVSAVLAVRNGEINDHPAFQWRAFMLDDARNFRGMESVKMFLDEMARLKMNVFHWHLTDDQGWRIEIPEYPLLTEVGSRRDSTHIGGWNSHEYDPNPQEGFYTQDQIREVLEYADARHITVMPEIEMPGHSSAAIAAYPWLGTIGKPFRTPCRFGYAADLFDVSRPEVVAFLCDILDEIMALFPGPVIHIGGDEVSFNMWENAPTVRKYMAEHNIGSLSEFQLDFTDRISAYIASKGRRMMGWSDIGLNPDENAAGVTDTGDGLADGSIIQFWKGDLSQITDVAERGYDVVNSYHMCTYLDYNYEWIPLKNAYDFSPIPDSLPENLHGKIIGFGCQLWTEWIMTDEKMCRQAFPRIAALAEAGWTDTANKDYGRFRDTKLPRLLEIWDAEGIVYHNPYTD